MNIGYFLNTYPVPSATFIRREIEAIEARGQVVFRFAARSFANVLVDDRDILEASRTVYLLQRGKLDLLKAFAAWLSGTREGSGVRSLHRSNFFDRGSRGLCNTRLISCKRPLFLKKHAMPRSSIFTPITERTRRPS